MSSISSSSRSRLSPVVCSVAIRLLPLLPNRSVFALLEPPAHVSAPASRASVLLGPSGFTGSTVRPNVEFVTAAKEAYHAAIAVARPNQPPSLVMPSLAAASPMPSRMNVAVSRANTSATAAVVRSDAMNMYVVKMPQAIR